MFKKSLIAVAVLGAAAFSAQAADVTVYGLIDTGIGYTNTDNGVAGEDDVSKFDMRSGMNSGSRFGIKGTEDLGNGLKVGFVLENGFDSDDGTFDSNGDRLFGREALVYLDGSFGQIGAGRVGELVSGNGTYGLFGGKVSPFSTGWSDIAGHKYVMGGNFGRLDNTLTYKSPNFAGFNAYAQYSFDGNTQTKNAADKHGREGSAGVDRQYAVGVTYTAGDLYLAGIVQQTNLASYNGVTVNDVDDPLTISVGGNYNFGVAKLYVATQYFKDSNLNKEATQTAQVSKHNGGYAYDGFGLTVGTDVPVFGGTAKALVGYMDAEDQAKDGKDMKRYAFSAGYEYPLSKRTTVYGGVGYYMDDYNTKIGNNDDSASVMAGNVGLIHKF